jgi:hypothetical protein
MRREIEEATPGDLLSSTANDHLANCVACETLAREQSRLLQIVSSLGTVEAPGDFDFRLRARLAGEKAGSARPFAPFAIGGLSFGLRSAAVAALLLLLGSALVFVNLRSQSDNSLAAKAPATAPPQTAPQSGEAREAVNPGAPDASSNPNGNQLSVEVAGRSNASDHSPVKPRSVPRTLLASLPGKGRIVTQDLSSTRAPVLTPENQVTGTYPTSAFPIDASYQSLKVSVDNGRGSSRTISLPTVSFGSKQSLSQNGSPLMASAREAW